MTPFRAQREALKAVATTLKRAGVPFALAGSYAGWARGGPESAHDVDFAITPRDADRALAALAEAGMPHQPAPEDWLHKVRHGEVVIDLIHRLPIGEVGEEFFAHCEPLSVDSVRMPVMSATDLVLSRALAFGVHACDLESPLATARALREQVDWERVRKESDEHPFARAFLSLLESLGVIDRPRRNSDALLD